MAKLVFLLHSFFSRKQNEKLKSKKKSSIKKASQKSSGCTNTGYIHEKKQQKI